MTNDDQVCDRDGCAAVLTDGRRPDWCECSQQTELLPDPRTMTEVPF